MKDIILQIIIIIIQIITNFFVIYTFTNKFDPKEYSVKQNLLCLLAICIGVILGFFAKKLLPLNIIVVSLPILLTLIFCFRITSLKSILIVFSNFAIFAIVEMLTIFLGFYIFGPNIINTVENHTTGLILIIIQSTIVFTLLISAHFFIKERDSVKDFFNNLSTKQIKLFIIFLLIYVVPQALLYTFLRYSFANIIVLLNTIQFIILSIFLFVYVKKSMLFEKSQSDLLTSELHNKTMVGMVDGVRTLKHDYNNIIQALNGYVSTKQYDKLQDHINYVLKECNIVNNLSVIEPQIFNDPAIYGIVGAKYFLAIEKDITVDLDITTNIQDINFPMPELSRILGIILDNAMEATLKAPTKYIRLEIKYDPRKCADVIRVVNTYDTTIHIDIETIYKKDFSTKKVKSGIGLWEVKKLVNKAKNAQVFATLERDKFAQNIIIESLII